MYTPVEGEFETVRELLKGKSLARFGDGEMKVMEKGRYTRETVVNHDLAQELRDVAAHSHPDCLVGIPTMDPRGQKFNNWLRHETRLSKFFNIGTGVKYYSAFISRCDSAGWIECREYYDLISQLWIDKPSVVVVAEHENKLLVHMQSVHPKVKHIKCPSFRAYSDIHRLEAGVLKAKPSIALLSCGVTATCLANRLAGKGIQTIDMGSIGALLMRLSRR